MQYKITINTLITLSYVYIIIFAIEERWGINRTSTFSPNVETKTNDGDESRPTMKPNKGNYNIISWVDFAH